MVPVRAALPSMPVACAAVAGEAHVLEVVVRLEAGAHRFDVRVRHEDEGWDHHADRFEVVSPSGEVLGVVVPEGIAAVAVRAHDSVHGPGGATVEVALPGR